MPNRYSRDFILSSQEDYANRAAEANNQLQMLLAMLATCKDSYQRIEIVYKIELQTAALTSNLNKSLALDEIDRRIAIYDSIFEQEEITGV